MAKPKELVMSSHGSSGIRIEFVKSRLVLYVSGWYDDLVGIEGHEIPLGEFLRSLNITLKDCEKAFTEKNSGRNHEQEI